MPINFYLISSLASTNIYVFLTQDNSLVAVFPGEAKMVRLESFLKLAMAQYGYWCGQQTEKLANEYDDELVFERSS